MLVLGVGAGAAVVITDRAELAELIELNIARNLPGNTGRLADGPHEVLFPTEEMITPPPRPLPASTRRLCSLGVYLPPMAQVIAPARRWMFEGEKGFWLFGAL